jgi:glycosyltransferase involved in cell wall biosynthesis
MVNKLYRFYEYVKRLFPWRLKALAKGVFLEVFFYKRAAFFCRKNAASATGGSVKIRGKTRVLFVTPHLVFGGAERILFDVVKNLSQKGLKPALCCALKKGEWTEKFEAVGDVYDLSRFGGLWRQKDAIVNLASNLGFNIVQFSNCEILYFALPYLKAGTGAATVNWIHVDPDYFSLLHAFGYRKFSPAIDKTVVTTESMKKFLIEKKYSLPEKISVVHNGVDLSLFDPSLFIKDSEALKDKYGMPKEHQAVVFISRLIREKDPFSFLKMARQVSKLRPRTTFIVAGDGYLRNAMVKRAKTMNIAEKVKFLGFREEIPEILSIASVFVSTSLTEGFGLSAAEAMAMEVPAVISDAGGHKELMSDGCGFRVKARDINGFTEKIGCLLSNESMRKDMGHRARSRIESEFSIDKTVSGMISLYDEMAGQA